MPNQTPTQTGNFVHDIVIAGGGPVGATLALALQQLGHSSVIIEPRAPTAPDAPEGRALALSHGSRLILERLGVWTHLPACTPIETIHVSQRGGFGFAELSAQEMRVPALGYLIGYAPLMRALEARLNAVSLDAAGLNTAGWDAAGLDAAGADAARITVLRGHALQGAALEPATMTENAGMGSAMNVMQLALQDHAPLRARLLAVADGGANAGLAQVKTRAYGQIALTCEVTTTVPHRNRAFERFTPQGPLALLPNPRGWSLVWIAPPPRIEALLALDAAAFTRELQNTFGVSLGAFTLMTERRTFPLVLNYATGARLPRTVLVGAAAQTLHPIAGQGLNLGLRDAWEFARLLARAQPSVLERDAGVEHLIAQHQRLRRRDRFATVAFTDVLVRAFGNDMPALRVARGLGLTLFGGVAPLKRALMRRMMFGAHG